EGSGLDGRALGEAAGFGDELRPERLLDARHLGKVAVGEAELGELGAVALLLGEDAPERLLQRFIPRDLEVSGIDDEDPTLDRPAHAGIAQALGARQRRDPLVESLEVAPAGLG